MRVLIDWKSGTFPAPEFALQLGAYSMLDTVLQEGQATPLDHQVQGAAVIHTGEKGCYPLLVLDQAALDRARLAFLEAKRVFDYFVREGHIKIPDQESYRFPVNGVWLPQPSVTYILRYIIAKPGLLNWYAKMAKDGKDPEEYKQQRAKYGSSLHHLIMIYLQGKTVDMTQAPGELAGAVVQVTTWCQKVKLEPLALEQRAFQAGQGYAGTIDCVADVDMDALIATVRKKKEGKSDGGGVAGRGTGDQQPTGSGRVLQAK